MSETPIEPVDPAARLNDSLVAFTGCIGEALLDICSYGLTIGETYVPFLPDPEDDCDENEEMCSQAWVRVESITPVAVGDSFGGDCGGVLRIDLEVGIIRCVEAPEDGEAPAATDVLIAATQAMTDMQTIYCAAMGCEVWESIDAGQWTPLGPLGMQVGGVWSFSVEV